MSVPEINRRAVVIAVGGSAVSFAAISLSRSRSWTGGGHGGPARTSFGSVAVLGSSRIETSRAGGAHGSGAHAQPAAHLNGGLSADAPVASAVHGAWTAGVVVDVEVHNRLRRPVELSPGQFRVRVDRGGPTVSLYSSDQDAAPLEPGATRTLQISYLAPPPDRRLSLLFDDTGSRSPVDLGPVGRRSAEGVWS
jgi:hypothetical protein